MGLWMVVDESKYNFFQSLGSYRTLMPRVLRTFSPEVPRCVRNLDFIENPGIREANDLDNGELPWSYDFLLANPNITLENVLSHPELPWGYEELSKNPNITLHDVLLHSELPWDYKFLSMNQNITFPVIRVL